LSKKLLVALKFKRQNRKYYLLFKVNLNKTKQKWNKLGSKEVLVVVVVVVDVVTFVVVVVSDEEDLDEDENMEAFKKFI
jgi:hypothetical protein